MFAVQNHGVDIPYERHTHSVSCSDCGASIGCTADDYERLTDALVICGPCFSDDTDHGPYDRQEDADHDW